MLLVYSGDSERQPALALEGEQDTAYSLDNYTHKDTRNRHMAAVEVERPE